VVVVVGWMKVKVDEKKGKMGKKMKRKKKRLLCIPFPFVHRLTVYDAFREVGVCVCGSR
jgi:hypothetical protein